MDPALSLESKADVVLKLDCFVSLLISCDEIGLNGLLDGVGREDFGARVCGILELPSLLSGNFEGTVPARALLVVG